VLFNSLGYLLFLAVSVLAAALLPGRKRMRAIGVLSLGFYAMWRWEFTLLISVSAFVDFLAALQIHRARSERRRLGWLVFSLTTNLGLLLFFKYTTFLWQNVATAAGFVGLELTTPNDVGFSLLLPLGISFYTFVTISYTIDVYRRQFTPTGDFLLFLTYVMFWPHMIAGPILRAHELIPQLPTAPKIAASDVATGLTRIIVGLFKKVVLADMVGSFVDPVFAKDAALLTAFDVWVAAFLFGFQIYLDFGGYSDIAVGSARLVGVQFPENFRWPYLSRSPREFWNRWHISLSSWIRDYLYLPLTGASGTMKSGSSGGISVATEGENQRRNGALFLTWFIMGLWHGAAWTFALWGLYHAALIYLYRRFRVLRALPERAPIVAWGITLLTAMAGWIPFRAASMEQALIMLGKLVSPFAYTFSDRLVDGHSYLLVVLLLLGMLAAQAVSRARESGRVPAFVERPAFALATGLMTAAILIYLRPVAQFIYFQF
jgi:D-alanyl-lipoteichoic acid acyltransferase DltB (MBOAT superfamily)